jgi:hypothetical protein
MSGECRRATLGDRAEPFMTGGPGASRQTHMSRARGECDDTEGRGQPIDIAWRPNRRDGTINRLATVLDVDRWVSLRSHLFAPVLTARRVR